MNLLSAAASALENRLPACAAVKRENSMKLCFFSQKKICRISAGCIRSPLPTSGRLTDAEFI